MMANTFSTVADNAKNNPTSLSGYWFFLAWFMILGVFFGISRTETGRSIIYYVLWLEITLIIAAYADEIVYIIGNASIIPQYTAVQPISQ